MGNVQSQPGNGAPANRNLDSEKLGFAAQLKTDWKAGKYTSKNMLMTICGSLFSLVLLITAGFYAKYLTDMSVIPEDDGNSIDWKSPKFICGYILLGLLVVYQCFLAEPVDDFMMPMSTSGPRRSFFSPRIRNHQAGGLSTSMIVAIGAGVFLVGFLGYYLMYNEDGSDAQNFDVENPRG